MKSKYIIKFIICALLCVIVFSWIYVGFVSAFTRPDSVSRASCIAYGMSRQHVSIILGEGRNWSASGNRMRYDLLDGYVLFVNYQLNHVEWLKLARINEHSGLISEEVTDGDLLPALPTIGVLLAAIGSSMTVVLITKRKKTKE